jgi:hypothetical protein
MPQAAEQPDAVVVLVLGEPEVRLERDAVQGHGLEDGP